MTWGMSFSNLMMYMAMIPDYSSEIDKDEDKELDINDLIKAQWA